MVRSWIKERRSTLIREVEIIFASKDKIVTAQLESISASLSSLSLGQLQINQIKSEENEVYTVMISRQMENLFSQIQPNEVDAEIKASVHFEGDITALKQSISTMGTITQKGVTSASRSSASGDGLTRSQIGQASTFTIIAKDGKNARRAEGGDLFTVDIGQLM